MSGQDHLVRLSLVEAQMERFASDAESEKETRKRANAALHVRLDSIDQQQRKLERVIYMGLGGLAVLQFFLKL